MPAQQNIWLWDDANSVWVEAPAVVVTKTMHAIGLVVAGAHKLYWVDCNPSAVNAEWALNDGLLPRAPIVLSEFHANRDSHVSNYYPPMQFNTGISLAAYDNMNAVTLGYI